MQLSIPFPTTYLTENTDRRILHRDSISMCECQAVRTRARWRWDLTRNLVISCFECCFSFSYTEERCVAWERQVLIICLRQRDGNADVEALTGQYGHMILRSYNIWAAQTLLRTADRLTSHDRWANEAITKYTGLYCKWHICALYALVDKAFINNEGYTHSKKKFRSNKKKMDWSTLLETEQAWNGFYADGDTDTIRQHPVSLHTQTHSKFYIRTLAIGPPPPPLQVSSVRTSTSLLHPSSSIQVHTLQLRTAIQAKRCVSWHTLWCHKTAHCARAV